MVALEVYSRRLMSAILDGEPVRRAIVAGAVATCRFVRQHRWLRCALLLGRSETSWR